MRRAPADALRAPAEMPIAGSPPRLSTHPDRFLAALHPPSTSALTSNPHSARCPSRGPTSRDFVPWRFLDACQLSVPTPSLLPASKNLHIGRHSASAASWSEASGIWPARRGIPEPQKVVDHQMESSNGHGSV